MFRITSPARSARIPAEARLRRALRVGAAEDLWVELAYYPGPRKMRSVLKGLWESPGFRRVAGQAEALNSRRLGSWTADVAQLLGI